MKNLKHLKTFENFSSDYDNIDESLFKKDTPEERKTKAEKFIASKFPIKYSDSENFMKALTDPTLEDLEKLISEFKSINKDQKTGKRAKFIYDKKNNVIKVGIIGSSKSATGTNS